MANLSKLETIESKEMLEAANAHILTQDIEVVDIKNFPRVLREVDSLDETRLQPDHQDVVLQDYNDMSLD